MQNKRLSSCGLSDVKWIVPHNRLLKLKQDRSVHFNDGLTGFYIWGCYQVDKNCLIAHMQPGENKMLGKREPTIDKLCWHGAHTVAILPNKRQDRKLSWAQWLNMFRNGCLVRGQHKAQAAELLFFRIEKTVIHHLFVTGLWRISKRDSVWHTSAMLQAEQVTNSL